MTENPGGMESVIMNYYRFFDRSHIQLEFLCNTEEVAYQEEIEQLGGVIYHIPARRDGRLAFHRALRRFFRAHIGYYDVFWLNTCSLANIDYLSEAKRVGIPRRIVHCHNAANGDSWLRGCLHMLNRKRARMLATDFWTCSEESNRWFYGEGIEKKSTYRLIQNAIPVERFLPDVRVRSACRQQLGLSDELVLGHIGRFHFQKNQEFLIPIVKELKRRKVAVCLLLIGQGEDLNQVRELARSEGVEGEIKFLGVRDDVSRLLQAMDVFVFPSRFEGLSIALLEAQAAGLPCVAADTISPKSKVAEEVTFLSLNQSASEWTEQILAYRHTERKNNKELFGKAGFDIEAEAKKVQQMLNGQTIQSLSPAEEWGQTWKK